MVRTQFTHVSDDSEIRYGHLQGAGEELGLDISQVDALTLRQLQHYVHSCFNAGDGAVSWPGCLVGSGEPSLLSACPCDALLVMTLCDRERRMLTNTCLV